MTISYRPLADADAEQFQVLRIAGLKEVPSAFGSSYEEECKRPLDSVRARLAFGPERQVLGAFAGGELVGMLGLYREESLKQRHKGFIWGMYVAPLHRGQGIGRELMRRTLETARTIAGMRQVNLTVNNQNMAARTLYRSLGFVVYGTEPAALMVDGVLNDEDMMVCVL
jgi:ribosomal protein S18 acetylase RimI-like enzyme